MAAGLIELRLHSLAQLFNTLDPSPFRERDLDAEVVTFILDSAREQPADAPIKLRVHLPEDAPGLADTVRQFFAARAQAESRALREHFLFGRRALLIGLPVMATCLFLAVQADALFGDLPAVRLMAESLGIFGWVAIWRPAEIFLYDWIPLARRRTLFRRLAVAEVTLQPATSQR